MVGMNSVPCIEHKGEESQYCNTKAFVGDTVRLFALDNSGYVDGVITGLDASCVYVNGAAFPYANLRSFNVYNRGDLCRSRFM